MVFAWCHRGVLSSWARVSVVFTGCCLSELPLSESYVRELPLCLHGAIVGCCHRGMLCSPVHRVSITIGMLPLSESYVRELALCLHRAIVDTRQRRVR